MLLFLLSGISLKPVNFSGIPPVQVDFALRTGTPDYRMGYLPLSL